MHSGGYPLTFRRNRLPLSSIWRRQPRLRRR